MTDEQRMAFRRQIGTAIMDIQRRNMDYGPIVLIPELVSALVSLAAFVAHENGGIARDDFADLCKFTTEMQWPDKPPGVLSH